MNGAQTKLPPMLIRADGGSWIGAGHLMRSLVLGRAWEAAGGKVTLAAWSDSPELLQQIQASGFQYLRVERPYPDGADLTLTLGWLERQSAQDGSGRGAARPWLVLDGYHFDAHYQRAVRAAGHRLLVLDDTMHLPFYHADVVLNQNLGATELLYPCEPDTLMLLGTRYALLRPEFLVRHSAAANLQTPGRAHRVLVTLGGADPENVTYRVMEALAEVPVEDLEVRVVVGAANPHYESLSALAFRLPVPVQIIRGTSQMAELMGWAHVAIAAGGTTAWELAFMGVPTLLLVLADNQRRVVAALERAGAALNLGPYDQLDGGQLARVLGELCENQALRRQLAQRSRQLIDGRGADRVVQVLQAMSGLWVERGLEVRPATLDDAVPLWRLAQEPLVRANSFNPNPFPLDQHLEWLQRKLADPNCRLWVLTISGVVAAQIRYDRAAEPDLAMISFAVASAFRGGGLGTRALQLTAERACRELGVSRVRGLVFPENTASARAFLKAGFVQRGETQEQGRRCLVFEHECGQESS